MIGWIIGSTVWARSVSTSISLSVRISAVVMVAFVSPFAYRMCAASGAESALPANAVKPTGRVYVVSTPRAPDR